MSSVFNVNEGRREYHNTGNNTFKDFPIGTRVMVICICQDFMFFEGNETGKVIRNSGDYLGIIVEFDEPRKFNNNYLQKEWNFSPTDLIILSDRIMGIRSSLVHI